MLTHARHRDGLSCSILTTTEMSDGGREKSDLPTCVSTASSSSSTPMHPVVPDGTSLLTDTLGVRSAPLVAPDEGGAVCATTAVDAKTVAAKTPKTRCARRSHATSRLDVARTGRCLGCYRHRRL